MEAEAERDLASLGSDCGGDIVDHEEFESGGIFWPDALPQAQAYKFVAGLEAKHFGIHRAPMLDYEAAQHFYLF